jgi:hypothetical protein
MKLGPTLAGYWRLFRAPKLAEDAGRVAGQ